MQSATPIILSPHLDFGLLTAISNVQREVKAEILLSTFVEACSLFWGDPEEARKRKNLNSQLCALGEVGERTKILKTLSLLQQELHV
jgi:hypothetical protein